MSALPRQNGAGPDRDVAVERRWTTQAAATVNASAEKLVALAETRGSRATAEDLAARNFAREALAHLADARNELVWWVEQVVARADNTELAGEITEAIGQALAATALAFDRADHARTLQIELRTDRRPA